MNLSSSRRIAKLALPTPSSARSVSSSPYGRTHVWRRRAPVLPNPVVPHFPQRVVLADGSTFVHWTTSPRATLKLTRDTTNHPLWVPWLAGSNPEDVEGANAGRLGRFRRKFEELGGADLRADWVEDSMEGQKIGAHAAKQELKVPQPIKKKVEGGKKKK